MHVYRLKVTGGNATVTTGTSIARVARTRRLIWMAAAAFLAGLTAASAETGAAAAGTEAAKARIEKLSDNLINVMKNANQLGYSGRYRTLEPVLRESYNFELMSKSSVGRRNWDSFTEEQRNKFRDLFSRMSISTYAARFKGYSGQSFEVVGVQPSSGGDIVVQSKLNNPDGEPVDLNYRMRNFNGNWQIIDVYLDGRFSELAKNRSEFTTVLRDKGYDGLVAAIEDMIRRNERNGAS